MLRRLLLASTVFILALPLALTAAIADEHSAKLAGHVLVPAATFIDPPADAPATPAHEGDPTVQRTHMTT